MTLLIAKAFIWSAFPLLYFSSFLAIRWPFRVGEWMEFKIKLFMGGSQIDDSFVAVAAVDDVAATSAQIAAYRWLNITRQ